MEYSKLVSLYEDLEKTSKRLEKTRLLYEFLKGVDVSEVQEVAYLIQGRVFPKVDETKIGMSDKLILKVIQRTTGESIKEINKLWSRKGDLGLVVDDLLKKKKQSTLFSQKLTVNKVISNIRKVADFEGKGTVDKKVSYIAELLGNASNVEAKYIVRTVLEQMRTGIQSGTLRDAIAQLAYDKLDKKKIFEEVPSEDYVDLSNPDKEKVRGVVQHAYDMLNDWGLILEMVKEKPDELFNVELEVGKPIKVMLYQKVKSIEEGFDAVGSPAMIEEKIDGFRMQIHCVKGKVKLFTRRLEEVTKQFPDVVKIVKSNVKSNDYILDTEIVGVDLETKRSIPFQQISQRIKRKYDIEKLVRDVPVCVKAFDVIELNGDNLLKIEFKERRKKLKSIVKEKKNEIELVKQIITSDVKKVEKFYNDSLIAGNEGIMMKSMDSVYKPGSRVGFGVKVKPVMETLDLVIVSATWGEGKRVKWFSSFTVACRDGSNLLEIGKVGTGIKEKPEEGVSFGELTKELKPLIIEKKGKSVRVKPSVVLEVNFEEIQKSTKYGSGYALRFPRVIRLRDDKGVSDVSSLKLVENLYGEQRGRG